MFGRKTDLKDDPLAIGDRNRQVVMERLKEFKIPLEADQTGGSTGRNITLDCATGEVVVRCQDGTGCTI
jgi:chemotaxis receptor (MCP) glutamine deamidase CheD